MAGAVIQAARRQTGRGLPVLCRWLAGRPEAHDGRRQLCKTRQRWLKRTFFRSSVTCSEWRASPRD